MALFRPLGYHSGAVLGCQKCGVEQPDSSRYCSNCGAQLTLASRVSVRKLITIIFTDLAGFTGLAEGMDAERLRAVMNRYFAEMKGVIERHGGTVEKFIGDAIMAVFGIPHVHEEDAFRAVKAALEMRDTLTRLNQEFEREWGMTIRVRTGINTGEVATGLEGGSLVLGDAVNVAARLEQAAPADEILLGPETHRLIEGAVEVEKLDPLTLKGKSEAVPAFRLVGLRTDASWRVSRFDVPMVARAREQAALETALARAVRSQACHLVLVLGDAGIGKSRLIAEFLGSIKAKARVVQGHCPSYGEGITFWPVVEVVKELAGVVGGDSYLQAGTKLVSLLEQADEGDVGVGVEQLGQLFGVSEVAAAADEILWAVRKLLASVARRTPLVVVLEDIHWAQPALLDFLQDITERERDVPLLVCCTARTEFLDRDADWGESRANVSRIQLQPLSERDSELLVENILSGDKLAHRALSRILAAAQGNPLYIQETMSMLMDAGWLRHDEGRWVPTASMEDVRVPPTLQSLLATRLDRLDSEERRVVEAAAVVGTSFSVEAVLALLRDYPASEVKAILRRLLDKQFLRPGPSESRGEALAFSHALMRDAAYSSTSKEVRAVLHELFADWFERTQAAARVGEYEELLGYHLEHAYLYRTALRPIDDHSRALARRGADRLTTAGGKAFSRGDMVAAANLLSRSLELLPEGDAHRLDVLPKVSEALIMTAEFERAGAALEEAFALADAHDDRVAREHAVLIRATQRLFTQPEGGAGTRADVHNAILTFEEMNDNVGLARSWRLLSLIDVVQGTYASAVEAMERAAFHAHRAGDRREELENLSWLPLSLFLGPTPASEAVRRCDDILARADGDRKVEGCVLAIRGALEAMLGNVQHGRRMVAEARPIFEDLGLRLWAAGAVAQLQGWVELLTGDPYAAERELRRGYDAVRDMGESGWLSTIAGFLAQALYAQGRFGEAEDFARISQETAGADDVYSQVIGRSVRAKVACRRSALDEGEGLGAEALALAMATDCLQLQGDALMDAAEIAGLARRQEQAVSRIHEALRLYEQKGSLVSSRRAKDELEAIRAGCPSHPPCLS